MSGARRIVVEVRPGEVRAAAVDHNDQPIAFRIERASGISQVGGVYFGRVAAVRREIGAAFVDIGLGADGFLNIKNTACDAAGRAVEEGASILVQISRDAVEGKGAGLTTAIDIAGQGLVLTPGKPGLGISSRISDDVVRARLKALFADIDLDATGLVVRTGAGVMVDTDIMAEHKSLQARWQTLLDGLNMLRAPAQVSPAPGLAERMLAQFGGSEIKEILVDDADTLRALEMHIAATARNLPKPVATKGGTPAFAAVGLEDMFNEALSPFIALPDGGSLIVTETPAMTTIDVNAGRAAAGNPERLALETNLQAARELAHALRLRGIGGLIAIDFLKMRDDANRQRVLSALSKAFRGDQAAPRVGGFSRFGIVDIVRRVEGASLAAQFFEHTSMPRAESVALDALAKIKELGGTGAVLRAAPEVCACLDGSLSDARKKLEDALGFDIRVEILPGAARETLEIDTP